MLIPMPLGISIGISAIVLIINVALYSLRNKVIAVRLPSIIFGILGALPLLLCLLAPMAALSWVCMAIVFGLCVYARVQLRWFVLFSIGSTAAIYLGGYWLVILPEMRRWDRIRNDFPVESIASRLAYEDRPNRLHLALPSELKNSTPSPAHLAHLETSAIGREGIYSRHVTLLRAHERTVRQFVDTPGFGNSRGIGMSSHFLYEDERSQTQEPLPQPSPSYAPNELIGVQVQVEAKADLLPVHDGNLADFLNPRDYGYVRDRDHVAGFRSHQFHQLPTVPKRWQLQRLELVGLLKYEEPVVYLSNNLPRHGGAASSAKPTTR